MRIAVPEWEGRISPVFDVATRLFVATAEEGEVCGGAAFDLAGQGVHARARQVMDFGVDVVICGAISRPLEQVLVNAGIDVVPQTCGSVQEVLAAYAAGRMTEQAFLMPGCCGRRRVAANQGPAGTVVRNQAPSREVK